MADGPDTGHSSAAVLLRQLAERGIEYVFANAGTDFASVIEAIAAGGGPAPRFITVPHENLAMAMAHGYYRMTGKIAAVMVHVTVGTANTLCQLMNMAGDDIPVLLLAGRTPLTETGHPGSRDTMIHWGQESFDQASMLREYVKWDFELRAGQSIAALVDRAIDIAMAQPRGPVYLSLPREPLHDPATPSRVRPKPHHRMTDPVPSAEAIATVAEMVRHARWPLIVTAGIGRTPHGFETVSRLALDHALPVVQAFPTDISLSSDHPMQIGFGFDMADHLARADLVIVAGCRTPWIPRHVSPNANARVVHFDHDPLVSRYPFRETDADLLVAGDPVAGLELLHDELGHAFEDHAARRAEIGEIRQRQREQKQARVADARSQRPIHPAWLAHCIDRMRNDNTVVVNEIGLLPADLSFDAPLQYLGTSHAGGLGQGLGTALGAKIAAPDKEVIMAVGDGSYMFGNPLPYHFVQQAEGLPILTIVANNHGWLAVKQSTLAVHPSGAAAMANTMPLHPLEPSPRYEALAAACGGVGYFVDDPEELPGILAQALDQVRNGVQACVNVHLQAVR